MKSIDDIHEEAYLVNKQTACRMLGGVSPRTIQRWVASGQLDAIRIGRNKTLFATAALREFAESLAGGEVVEATSH